MTLPYGLSFLAGLLTTLSPCVLPVLPMIVGSGLQRGRFTPLWMIVGLMGGFVIVGTLLSRLGSLAGADGADLRIFSAIFLILVGGVFLIPALQTKVSERMSPMAGWGSRLSGRFNEKSPWGAVLIGLLLGVVWSPCAGPTLGVAVGLAAQEGGLGSALSLMIVYAIGAALPMAAIAYGARGFFTRNRGRLMGWADRAKPVLGAALVATGLLVVTGFDKTAETFLLEKMPAAWVDLVSKY